MKNKKQKAFLGALIGGVLGVASIINQNKIANEQLENQEKLNNENKRLQQAEKYYQEMNNTEAVDDYYTRVGFKNGGKVHYTDRIRNIKKYSYGGRNRKK